MTAGDLKQFLEKKVDEFNQPSFVKDDPISIPHLFTKKQDIEIAGFFAAVFSWGNRTTILNKSKELMQLMEMQPHEFCLNHALSDLKKFMQFNFNLYLVKILVEIIILMYFFFFYFVILYISDKK